MVGWKIVIPYPDGSFCSAFSPLNPYVRWYRLNAPTLSPSAPLFFQSDEASAADLLWALRSNGVMAAPVALLRVEAQDAFEIGRVAQNEADYSEFWRVWAQGGVWDAERAYGTHPHTFCAPTITPLAVAWRGLQFGSGDDEAAQLAEVQSGMARVRAIGQPAPVKPTVSVYFPVARA